MELQLGFALVLVTHDPVEVQGLCDSLAVLENGRIAEHASINEIDTLEQSELGMAFARALR